MDYALKFQKLCQVEARRLLLVVGIIAFVFLLQSFTIPNGNVFLFLYPSDMKILVPGKSISPNGDGDFSPGPEMVGRVPPLNDSTLTDLSSVPEMVTNAEAQVGKRIKSDNIRTEQKEDSKFKFEAENGGVLDNTFELDDDRVPDKESTDLEKSPRSQNNKTQYNISASINNVAPEQSSPKDEVRESDGKYSLDTVQKENDGSDSEKVPSGNTSFISPLVTPAPIVMTNLTSLKSDSSTSITLTSSNTSSVGNQAAAPPPKDVPGSPVTPTGNLTMNKNAAIEHYNEEISPPSVTSVSEMNRILVQSRVSSCSMKPRWSSDRDQEILSAKLQIENAPIITSGPELYAPIFRNISMFKRSYELMERVLKVYIYKEGSRPIFHQPVLKGIYASEGWFMRSMEGNKQFVVKDPTKAHLFYLPFSTRMLQTNMYVPDSHSHQNLIEYLKNYLDVIVAKYPYWNRTEGADHFLAACHDWAPAETRQYMSNCIRALCNSDINVGFTIGKDVSLPETLISNQKDPLKYLGGELPRKRPTLAFFAGGMHGYLRPILLQYWENKDPDMKIFGKLGRGKKNKMNYISFMRSSKYCICAKGYEVNSPRVVESIYYECVPVIISDNFVPPFFDILDWEKIAVFVPEKDIPKLKEILLSIPEKKYLEMQMRVKKVQQHFLWHSNPVKYDIFHMILHSIWYNRVFQIRAKDS